MKPKHLKRLNLIAIIYLCIMSLAATFIIQSTYQENGLTWEETITVDGESSTSTRHLYQEGIGLIMFVGLLAVSCLNYEYQNLES